MSPILCVWLTQLYIWRETLENWNLFHSYVITPSLLKTSHLQCKISQVAYVCHHLGYTGHDIHTFWQPLLLKTSHALYWLHHTPYIWHLIYSVWCHIHYVCHITQWPYLWHQTLYVYDIFTWYGNRHSVMTTQPSCAFPATMPDITLNVFLTLQTIYQFYEKHWMYVITASICMAPFALHMTSHTLYLTSYRRYVCHQIHSVDDITANLFMRSHPLFMSTSYPLYTTKYSLYLYHHIHCTCFSHPHFPWYHTLCIYDIAPTICLTLDTLYKVSHP